MDCLCKWCGGSDVRSDLCYPQAGLSYLRCARCGVSFADDQHGRIDYCHYNGKAADQRSARGAACLEATFSRDCQVAYLVNRVDAAVKGTRLDGFSLLDIGCGPGDLLAALRDRYPKATLAGIDPSQENVREAWERHRISVQMGYWKGAEPDRHDVVTMFGNLMLHEAPRESLELAFRCLKPGGVLLFDVKNSQNATRRLLRMAKPLLRDGRRIRGIYRQAFHGMPWGLTYSALRRSVEEIGFFVQDAARLPGRNGELGEQTSLALRAATWLDRLCGSGAWLLFLAEKPSQSQSHRRAG